MMKKFVLTTFEHKIEYKEIEKENDYFFWIDGFRYAKAVNTVLIFDSYQSAKDYLISHVKGKIQALQDELKGCKEELKRIESQPKTGEKK